MVCLQRDRMWKYRLFVSQMQVCAAICYCINSKTCSYRLRYSLKSLKNQCLATLNRFVGLQCCV